MDGLVIPTRAGVCEQLLHYALARRMYDDPAAALGLCAEDAATFDQTLNLLASVLAT